MENEKLHEEMLLEQFDVEELEERLEMSGYWFYLPFNPLSWFF